MISLTIMPLFIGTTELMMIGGIALLLFGGKKLPEMMRGLGQGIQEFKKGAKEVTEPINEAKQEVIESLDDAKDSVSDNE